MRALVAAIALGSAVGPGLLAAQQRFDLMKADDLYTAYLRSGAVVLEDAFPNVQRFEAFRKDFRDRVLTAWEAVARDPMRAMYMLDISLATDRPAFRYWPDFMAMGMAYLARRPVPPGSNARMDAFELLWDKTALAYLEGRRQPELVEQLAGGLTKRILATPAADGRPALIDPWIELTMGFMHEGYVIADAARFASRVPRALESYAAAATYDSTRAEATVRAAGLQLRSDQAADALATLDRFDERWTEDGVLIYWARLLRAKALDALERPDESIAAYRHALELAPNAQAPVVGMMMVESRRGRDDAAEAIAVRVRTARDPVDDPWWLYPHGELRFFDGRLAELRDMARGIDK